MRLKTNPAVPCFGAVRKTYGSRNLSFDPPVPDGFQKDPLDPIVLIAEGARADNTNRTASVGLEGSWRYFREEPGTEFFIPNPSFANAIYQLDVFIYCVSASDENNETITKWEVVAYFTIVAEAFNLASSFFSPPWGGGREWLLSGQIVKVLNSTCIKELGEPCRFPNLPLLKRSFRHLDTPLEITFSANDTSLGPWENYSEVFTDYPSVGEDFSLGPPDPELVEIANNTLDFLKENFSVTVRVTRRDSCDIAQCNCSLNLYGLKVVYEGKEFTIGTPSQFVEGDTVWAHEVQFGGILSFYRQTFVPENLDIGLPALTTPTEQKFLDLFCTTDEELRPFWMAEVTTVCQQFTVVDGVLETTHYQQRLFESELLCYKGSSAATCPGTAYANQFIPLGSPENILEDEDSPFDNGVNPECNAPDFPDFTISQDCGS